VRLRTAIVTLGCLGLLASCSTTEQDFSDVDNPPPTTIKVYARTTDGVIESITDRFSTTGSNLNEWAAPIEQARCAAEKIVGMLGVDRLLALGFEPEVGQLDLPYTPEEEASALNVLVGCIDFTTGLIDLVSSYGKLSVPSTACLLRAIDRQGLTRDFAAGLLRGVEPDALAGEGRLGIGVTRGMIECLGDEDLLPVIPQDPFPQDKRAADEAATSTTSSNPTTTLAPR